MDTQFTFPRRVELEKCARVLLGSSIGSFHKNAMIKALLKNSDKQVLGKDLHLSGHNINLLVEYPASVYNDSALMTEYEDRKEAQVIWKCSEQV